MRFLIVSLVILGGAIPALADCSPEEMIKIVYYNATPGIDPQSFATKPQILYRLGSHYQRLEEAPDQVIGLHGLYVSNNRDHWMVNLADKTGRHIVDRAETYDSHAPIMGGPGTPFVELEFGCEIEYMKAEGIEPTSARVGEHELLQYDQTIGESTVRLMVSVETGEPYSIGLDVNGELVYLLRYTEYESGLATNPSLFERPAGISYVDAN